MRRLLFTANVVVPLAPGSAEETAVGSWQAGRSLDLHDPRRLPLLVCGHYLHPGSPSPGYKQTAGSNVGPLALSDACCHGNPYPHLARSPLGVSQESEEEGVGFRQPGSTASVGNL